MKQNFLRGSTWSSVWQSGTGKARKVSACMAIVVAGLIAGCNDDHTPGNTEEENSESGKITLQVISGNQAGRVNSVVTTRFDGGDLGLRKRDRLELVATITAPAEHAEFNWSATAVAIEGTKAYITWHSDRQATTEANKWGGAVDVVDLTKLDNPNEAITCTALSDSMKFNHVLVSGDKLFLAATHARTSGAIARVSMNGSSIDEEAEYIGFPGVSVNAVAPYDGKLIAVSGHSMGTYATFDAEVEAGPYYYGPNADKVKANKICPAGATLSTADALMESLKDFGGKYVTTDENSAAYVLYNKEGKATIVKVGDEANLFVLNTELKSTEKYAETYDYTNHTWAMAGDKQDYYGKHVFAVRNGVAYVACGVNGLHVYNLSNGEETEISGTQAIGVYADDNYVYASTGAGLRVYKDNLLYAFEVEKYDNNGKAATDVAATTGTAERHSPNFVAVNKGENGTYIYIAYGQSGVRVYKLIED